MGHYFELTSVQTHVFGVNCKLIRCVPSFASLLEAYEPVIMHSTQALKVDQENAKAFYRRGLAQEALGKTQASCEGMGVEWRLTF